MPGIVVGIDESAHGQQALDWAMREAGLRQANVAVVTVIPVMASPWTKGPLSAPNADEAIAHARKAVEEAIAKSSADLVAHHAACPLVIVHTGK